MPGTSVVVIVVVVPLVNWRSSPSTTALPAMVAVRRHSSRTASPVLRLTVRRAFSSRSTLFRVTSTPMMLLALGLDCAYCELASITARSPSAAFSVATSLQSYRALSSPMIGRSSLSPDFQVSPTATGDLGTSDSSRRNCTSNDLSFMPVFISPTRDFCASVAALPASTSQSLFRPAASTTVSSASSVTTTSAAISGL